MSILNLNSKNKTKSPELPCCSYQPCTILIENKIIEQVKSFNYLGNMVSYERELDIDSKLNNYLKITSILNNVFRPQKNP
jgi:hypothetical protein